jgi:hypothetical protein
MIPNRPLSGTTMLIDGSVDERTAVEPYQVRTLSGARIQL